MALNALSDQSINITSDGSSKIVTVVVVFIGLTRTMSELRSLTEKFSFDSTNMSSTMRIRKQLIELPLIAV